MQAQLEDLLKAMGYRVRYEKGNFKSGYCLVEHTQMAVVNKFHPIETRISALADIALHIATRTEQNDLTEEQQSFLATLKKPNVDPHTT